DVADSLYVLVSGRLQVYRTGRSGEVTALAETAAGETIGEMAFFTGERRSASVSALRDSVVIRVPHAVFEQLIAARPAVLRQVAREQMERIRRTNERVAAPARITNIAVVPLGEAVPLAEVCARLGDALRPHGV